MLLAEKQSEDVSEWYAEMDRYEFNQDDLEIVQTAVLPDELALYEVMADNDPEFTENWCDWEEFIYENWLFLALEQSCCEGFLLPADRRALRLQSCPEATLSKLRGFLNSVRRM